MGNCKLPTRKRDLLDELNLLRNRRSLAYRFNNQDELADIHLEMKAFWLRNGWTEQDAEDEYLYHVNECADRYITPLGNPAISHIVFSRQSGEIIHLKSIAELSHYWLTQNISI